MYEFISHATEETQNFGRQLGKHAIPGDIFLLSGKLGAGKTSLTQGIAWGLGINEYAVSPTFVLIREMQGRLPLYHVDLYRLEHMEEIDDLGLDEYFFGKGVSIVEWADKAPDILPQDNLWIQIDYMGENERRLVLTPNGNRYQSLLADLEFRT